MIEFTFYNLNFVWGFVAALVIYFIWDMFLIDLYARMSPILSLVFTTIIGAVIYFILGLVFGGV